MTLAELLAGVMRRWRMIVLVPLIAGVVAVAYWVLAPAQYDGVTSFAPEQRNRMQLPAGLLGVASQFGLDLGQDATHSPRFYADLLRTRPVLERALLSRFPATTAPTDSTTLLALMRIRGDDSTKVLQKATRAFERRLGIRIDNQTDVVTLAVRLPRRDLAAAVANRMVDLLNDFNAHYRQSQARMRRAFLQQRLPSAEAELHGAEDALSSFYRTHQLWRQSPELTVEQERLNRQVDVRQEVYLTLRREFETARLQEVDDTPVITVIAAAVPPAERAAPKLLLLLGVAIVGGGATAIVLASFAEYAAYLRRADAAGFGYLLQTAREVGSEIRHATLRR